MYALVAPLVRLPRSMMPGIFDYHLPDELVNQITAGTLVRLPWRNKLVTGVVIELRPEPTIAPEKTKDVSAVLHPNPLPPDVLAGLKHVAETGVVPLANAALALIPEAPKRWKIPEDLKFTPPTTNQFTTTSLPTPHSQINYATFEEKITQLVNALTPTITTQHSALIITPHHHDLAPIEARLTEAFPNIPIIRFDGTLNKTLAWRRFITGLEPASKIIIGTRQACLAPVTGLDLIITLETTSRDHRSFDQQPKFDAREVVQVRAQISGAKLIDMSASDRVENHFPLSHSPTFPLLTPHPSLPPPTIINTSAGRNSANTLFPEPLQNHLHDALGHGLRAMIIHNRRGSFRVLTCTDCQQPVSCPTCYSLPTIHGSELRCHRCGYHSLQPSTCPTCHSPNIIGRGWGIDQLAQSVREAFPDSTVTTIDTDSILSSDRWDIAIGTTSLIHQLQELPWSGRLGAIALHLDGLIGGPDFRSFERAWQTTTALRRLASAHGCPAILLTRRPDDPSILRLLHDESTFLSQESTDRQKSNYPPAGKLITVTMTGATKDAALKNALAAKTIFTSHSPTFPLSHSSVPTSPPLTPHFTVFGPYPAGTPLRHGKWRAAFAIKSPNLSPELIQALSKMPETCSIDTNPESPE